MTPQEVQPDSRWAVLREAQAEALHIANTGMITAVDLGDPYDIHPKNKQDVGKRLAALSLADTYRKGTYHMPVCTGYKVYDRTLALAFDSPVQANAGEVKGFVLAGPDGVSIRLKQRCSKMVKVSCWNLLKWKFPLRHVTTGPTARTGICIARPEYR